VSPADFKGRPPSPAYPQKSMLSIRCRDSSAAEKLDCLHIALPFAISGIDNSSTTYQKQQVGTADDKSEQGPEQVDVFELLCHDRKQ